MENPEYTPENSYIYQENNEKLTLKENVDMSMKVPAKIHLNKLEEVITQLNQDLKESKKSIQKIRGELLYQGFQNNSENNDVSSFIVSEAIKLTNTFRLLCQEDIDETMNVKNEINNLIQEKIRICQETLVLENRVEEAERDLGYLL